MERQDSCVMEDSVESDRIAHPGQDKTGQDKRERGACWPCEVFFRWRMVGRFGFLALDTAAPHRRRVLSEIHEAEGTGYGDDSEATPKRE